MHLSGKDWEVFVPTVGKTQLPKKGTVFLGEEECSECEGDQDCTNSVQLSSSCSVWTDRGITSLEERQALTQTSSQEGGASPPGWGLSPLSHQVHSLPCRVFLGQFLLGYFVSLHVTHTGTRGCENRQWGMPYTYHHYLSSHFYGLCSVWLRHLHCIVTDIFYDKSFP